MINAIASNPKIWKQCAIIITYDESDGLYDHVPPRIRAYGPDSPSTDLVPLSRGIRVPLILISPYARTHAVSHVEGDHNAVIETINAIFGLPALASLPDEAQALAMGNSAEFNQCGPPGFQQKCLGPRDINSKISDSLLSGFDPRRLLGISPPLPASLAMIPDNVVTSLPHYGGNGCLAIGITPEDIQQGVVANPPAGFNPLPSTCRRNATEQSQGPVGAPRGRPRPLLGPRIVPLFHNVSPGGYMRILSFLLTMLLVCCSISDATAGSVAERVKARGLVRCGSVERPGLAGPDGKGGWTGLEVDVCRAVAAAVLGSPERIEYHKYDAPKDFDAVRNQQDDIYFLTGSEIAKQKLAGKVLPGPTVFVESQAVMAPVNSAEQHLDDSRREEYLLHDRKSGRADPECVFRFDPQNLVPSGLHRGRGNERCLQRAELPCRSRRDHDPRGDPPRSRGEPSVEPHPS